jgi:glycosyltransferase involved in cell wall biosynthesis
MRVLALTNLYPNPYQPNRAPFNRHQFRLLAERHPVRVVAPVLWTDARAARRAGRPPLPAARRVTLDGLVIDHPTYWYTPKVLRGAYGRFFLWSVERAFRAAVAEFRPDLVLGSWAYPDGWAAVRLARRCGLPVVIKVHGSDIRLLSTYPRRLRGTVDALRAADGIIAVSQELADRVIGLGVDPDRVTVVMNSVDLATFRPGDRAAARARLGLRPDVRHLLAVGNLTHVKGPDVLLDACSRLADRIGTWELHLVGSGPLHDPLRRRAARLGLADWVRFHGSLPHSTLPQWFQAADALVLASRSEGAPNVVLEAAACACPVVASRVGGVPEIADLGVCRTVPSERPDLLAAGIVELLTRPAPVPGPRPRDWKEAAAEVAAYLEDVAARFASGRRHLAPAA